LLDKDIADHKILSTAILLQKEEVNCKVILVSKDINLRIKAKAMNLNAEDYETGKVKNIDQLYTGRSIVENLTSDIIQKIKADDVLSDLSLIENNKLNNQFYIFKNGKQSVLAFYSGLRNQLERVKEKRAYGIKPMSAGQTFVQHAILNDDIKLVTVQGVSGTGKTLLALAYSLEQSKNFKQIIIARPIVPLGNNDIGFLPGDIDRKIGPYMEPLWDNLSFIKNQFKPSDKSYKYITKLIQEDKIVITPLAYIRGRSISDAIFIIDEAQNLTPHEAKTIITRAGDNCKIIFTGDINQIDTPYLDEKSNGLSYIIDKLKGQKLFSHITLNNVERSELASIANDLL
jgi:PhoH-like ATPase